MGFSNLYHRILDGDTEGKWTLAAIQGLQSELGVRLERKSSSTHYMLVHDSKKYNTRLVSTFPFHGYNHEILPTYRPFLLRYFHAVMWRNAGILTQKQDAALISYAVNAKFHTRMPDDILPRPEQERASANVTDVTKHDTPDPDRVLEAMGIHNGLVDAEALLVTIITELTDTKEALRVQSEEYAALGAMIAIIKNPIRKQKELTRALGSRGRLCLHDDVEGIKALKEQWLRPLSDRMVEAEDNLYESISNSSGAHVIMQNVSRREMKKIAKRKGSEDSCDRLVNRVVRKSGLEALQKILDCLLSSGDEPQPKETLAENLISFHQKFFPKNNDEIDEETVEILIHTGLVPMYMDLATVLVAAPGLDPYVKAYFSPFVYTPEKDTISHKVRWIKEGESLGGFAGFSLSALRAYHGQLEEVCGDLEKRKNDLAVLQEQSQTEVDSLRGRYVTLPPDITKLLADAARS